MYFFVGLLGLNFKGDLFNDLNQFKNTFFLIHSDFFLSTSHLKILMNKSFLSASLKFIIEI